MKWEVQLTVNVTEIEPERITELTGLTPSAIASAGWLQSGIQRTTNRSWIYMLPPPTSDLVTDGISELISIMEKHSNGIREAARNYKTQVRISLTREEPQNNEESDFLKPITIPSELIRKLGNLNVGLEIVYLEG
jgi:hypothetical protein